MSLTRLAHSLISDHFLENHKGLAIDATCGNGHDTEFLGRQGFEQIIGFDIQTQAIENTRERVQSLGLSNVTLHQVSHQALSNYIDSKISCAMFNFGYLPRANKAITTQSESSLNALNAALHNLKDDGLICMICYPGHVEGAIETNDIRHWFTKLDVVWRVKEYTSDSPKPEAPILFTITHRH